MENETLRNQFAEFADFVIKLKNVGNDMDNFIIKNLPSLEGRDFSKPDTFTDEEITTLFNWLEEE